jgi:hypothetical protein
MLEWGWVRPRNFPARMDVGLFALGCGAIMHCYSDGNGRFRECFRSKYRNLLDFVFGAEGGCSRGPAACPAGPGGGVKAVGLPRVQR